VSEPVVRTFGDDLKGRRFSLAQAAEPGDFHTVSHGCRESRQATAGCRS